MEDLGMGFSIEADRRRCLKSAGLALGCMVGIWLFSLQLAIPRQTGFIYLGDLAGILFLSVAGWVFSVGAWVRWLDWKRGSAKLKRGV